VPWASVSETLETRLKPQQIQTPRPAISGVEGFDLAGVEPAIRERIIDLSFPGWKWAHPHEDGAAQ
jgi:hypothetical protein